MWKSDSVSIDSIQSRIVSFMNPRTFLKKLLRNYHDYGLFVSLQKSLQYLVKPCYCDMTYRIYRVDLDTVTVKENRNCDFDFRLISKDDTALIRQIEDMEEWLKDKVADMIGSQGLCMVALDGDKVAGFNLVSLDEGCLLLINYSRQLKRNEAWSQQITVQRDYRRRGLGSALRHKVFEELTRRGFKRLYGGSQINNRANLNLSKKVGFREIADIRYTKLFNRSALRYKRVRDNGH